MGHLNHCPYIHICMFVTTHTCAHTETHMHTYIFTCVHPHMHIYICTHVPPTLYTYVHMCIHVHTCTHVRTHIHSHRVQEIVQKRRQKDQKSQRLECAVRKQYLLGTSELPALMNSQLSPSNSSTDGEGAHKDPPSQG